MIEFPTLHVHGTKEGSFAKGENLLTKDGFSEPRNLELVQFEDVALATENTPILQGFSGLRLEACWSASTGLAARFARRLETQILAPTHPTCRSMWAKPTLIALLPEDLAKGAYWVLFGPAGEIVERIHPDAEQNSLIVGSVLTMLDLKDSYGDDAAKAMWEGFLSSTAPNLEPIFIAGEPAVTYGRIPDGVARLDQPPS